MQYAILNSMQKGRLDLQSSASESVKISLQISSVRLELTASLCVPELRGITALSELHIHTDRREPTSFLAAYRVFLFMMRS
jgi:hypothetical protein